MTIVTEFWKLNYDHSPTGMYTSGDIIQAKLDNLLGDTKVLKT